MKHRLFAITVLCLTLFLSACQQETIAPTDGATTGSATEPTGTTGTSQLLHTHSYTAGEVVDGSCTEDGYTMMRCECGVYYRSNFVKAPGHDYKTQVVEPTATEKGYTLYTCKRCGHSYKDNEKDPVKPTPLLEVSQWLPDAKEPMSYDEFFSEDRALSGRYSNGGWYRPYGEGYAFFQVYARDNSLAVTSQATDAIYPIPGLTAEDANRVISTDGRYYYLKDETQIHRVDMVSGESTQLAAFDMLHAARMYGDDILLYAATVDGVSKLCRLYLPEMKLDVLYEGFDTRAPYNWFNFASSIRTNTSITWETLNPEFLDVLIAEINDPNSKYKNISPELWANPDSLQSYIYLPTMMMQSIQDETGIKCQIRDALNPSTGEITETLGIIDNCWHGSGLPHDHFNMNTYDVDPVWALSEPVAVSNIFTPEELDTLLNDENYYAHYVDCPFINGVPRLCLNEDGVYIPISDTPIITYMKILDTFLCITPDHTLVEMSKEGKYINTIYTAQFGALRSRMRYEKGILYFMDDEYIMELDFVNSTVRSLVKAPYCGNFYPYEIEGQTILYVESFRGMSFGGWEINIADQTIKYNYHL